MEKKRQSKIQIKKKFAQKKTVTTIFFNKHLNLQNDDSINVTRKGTQEIKKPIIKKLIKQQTQFINGL